MGMKTLEDEVDLDAFLSKEEIKTLLNGGFKLDPLVLVPPGTQLEFDFIEKNYD